MIKNVSLSVVTLSVSMLLFQSCQKDGANTAPTSPTTNADLSSAKTEIKQGEPLVIVAPATGNSTSQFVWSVNPPANSSLTSQGNQATVSFNRAGKYVVTAGANGKTFSKSIKVNDSIYDSLRGRLVSLKGDQITLAPMALYLRDSIHRDSLNHETVNGKAIYLYFNAMTQKLYGRNSHLNFSVSQIDSLTGRDSSWSAKGFAVNFLNVFTSDSLKAKPVAPLHAVISIASFSKKPRSAYKLVATLNGQLYSGSFVLASHRVTFTWNYTSGVIINPKEIKY